MATEADTKKLEAIQSTLASDGWRVIMDDVQAKLDSIKEEFTNPAVSLEMLRFGQGRITVYRELLSLASTVNLLLSHAEEDAQDLADEING